MPEAPRLAGGYVLRWLATDTDDEAVVEEAAVDAAADNAAEDAGFYDIVIFFAGAIFL